MNNKFFFWMGIVLVLLIAAGCAVDYATDRGADPSINVVATIFPIGDIIEQLGGERVAVSYLLPAGASPHTYEPTVEQAKMIAEAQLFVLVGAGLDDWALRLTEAAGSDLVVIKLADSLTLLESGQYYRLDEIHGEHQKDGHHDDGYCHEGSGHDNHCHEEQQEQHDEHDVEQGREGSEHDHHCHDHSSDDPHIWLDPLLVRDLICPRLYEELVSISPEHAAYFEERLNEFAQQLTLLHEEIDGAVSGFSKRDFISFHSAWQYFGQRYGLREIAVIAEFPGQEPSAGWVAELIGLIREKNISAILTEPQFSPTLAERIAEESGARVLVIDPLGGENVPGRESYLELMRFNLEVFIEALK